MGLAHVLSRARVSHSSANTLGGLTQAWSLLGEGGRGGDVAESQESVHVESVSHGGGRWQVKGQQRHVEDSGCYQSGLDAEPPSDLTAEHPSVLEKPGQPSDG